jgi:hypothetical protein
MAFQKRLSSDFLVSARSFQQVGRAINPQAGQILSYSDLIQRIAHEPTPAQSAPCGKMMACSRAEQASRHPYRAEMTSDPDR